jgi:hypothetical protein
MKLQDLHLVEPLQEVWQRIPQQIPNTHQLE